tara:strand:+ start:1726 stop:3087 length:1362 start_codon:yes stop_codon:yes gene_type:complete
MPQHDIFMPALSSTMTEGKIVEWLKNPGDKVQRGESVLVVESDKADMDVESFQDGYLAAILMPAGSIAPVGETIGLIVESQEEIENVQSKKFKSKESIKDQQTNNKKSSEPKIEKISEIKQNDSPNPIDQSENENLNSDKQIADNNGRIVATPKARNMAQKLGINLSNILGSGPKGRIQAEDVQKAIDQPNSLPWVQEGTSFLNEFFKTPLKNNLNKLVNLKGGNSFGKPGQISKFNTLQQAVNKNMSDSLSVPCFRVGYSINTNKLDELYKRVKSNGVTMTAILAKAIAQTLDKHPQVNSCFTPEGISYPKEINIAIAVAMEDGGLITPVLKNARRTDLFELSRQWKDLVQRSRSKQLQPDEYSSGTFTLSNLGMFGVDRFDAILPPGTGAILAVAASRPTVIALEDGSIAVRKIMQVNLTADHRVIYGADAAAFLKDLSYLIEFDVDNLIA